MMEFVIIFVLAEFAMFSNTAPISVKKNLKLLSGISAIIAALCYGLVFMDQGSKNGNLLSAIVMTIIGFYQFRDFSRIK